MFIIDFDDTLFDTHGFKQVLTNLPEDLYKESEKIKNFLFPETISFLEFLKETNQPIVLLSLGEDNWQKMKIDITGIAKFFHSIHITAEDKELSVSKILNDFTAEKDIWFINDKIEETKKIIQHFPSLKPILKMSPRWPEEEYKLSLMPYFSSLIEIQQYVKQQIK
ncbi:MAG: Uncharacterized protein G01um101413_927 [Parcubacteria group bacterium Gr01-1014_13]|nr:MAG: Uncharacterized protein G01um101413_927 [Parcubacteria group bacterium Gr01-1014_13]